MKPTMIGTLLACSTAVLLLSGCMGGPSEGNGPTPLTPTSRYSLQIEPGIERIALAVHDNGLSANQTQVLGDMVNRFAAERAPMMTVEAPSGDDRVSSELAWRIKGVLEAHGVPTYQVRVVTYAAPNPRAPILVGFDTARTVVPQCGREWTSLTRTGSNAGSSNFGCAINANLAAQIANPRDIATPRQMTSADNGRRSVVLDNYRAGRPTAAGRETLVEGSRVSSAVN